jgi:hypothetical protein
MPKLKNIDELLKKNDKKSYAAWLAESGSYPENERLEAVADASLPSLKRKRAGGVSFEKLAMDNLDKSGYADYLKSQAKEKDDFLMRSAEDRAISAELKSISGYGRYLSKYDSVQQSIKDTVTELLINERCFDSERAYSLAVSHGLNEENARFVSANATRLAMEKIAKDAIAYARRYNFSKDLTRKYAKKLGLNNRYINKVVNELYPYNDTSVSYDHIDTDEYENELYSSKKNS